MFQTVESISNEETAISVKSLLIVSEYIHPEQNSTGYYWDGIIRRMGKAWGRVRIITPSFTPDPQTPYPACIQLDRFRTPTYNTRHPLTRLVGQIRQVLSLAWKLFLTVHRGDTLMAGTNPAMGLLLLAIMRRMLGFRWVLLVHDIFPNNLIPGGLSTPERFSFKAATKLFQWAYRQADQLITIGRDMSCVLEAQGVHASKITYIRNWVDLETIRPMATPWPTAWTELPTCVTRVFVFFGNMGRLQGLPDLLEGIALAKLQQAAFVFIGRGALVDEVKAFCEAHPNLNCFYAPSIPGLSPEQVLSLGHVALIPLVKGMYGLGVPSKVCFSLAAGKPVLYVGDIDSELHTVIQETRVGWFTPAGNPQALAECLRHIALAPTLPTEADCRMTAERLYRMDTALDKIERLLLETAL